MRIVADENIPLIQEFFGPLGDVETVAGRHMSASLVSDADVLLVRSVTKVDQALLDGSRVKFVATATIGVDHIDLDYLKSAGIGFASAPGCNAKSVVEYVISALLYFEELQGFKLSEKRVGILGQGNVGGELRNRLEALGVECLAYDPILEEQGVLGLSGLDDVLACDIITIHTPLTKAGPHATYHLFDELRLSQLRSGAILLNTARGPIIDNQALLHTLQQREDLHVVLDVWEPEPLIDTDLAKLVSLATPHIAGYSLDGKMMGTAMIYQAVCQALGLPIRKKLGQLLPEPPVRKLILTDEADHYWALRAAVRTSYDIRSDTYPLLRSLSGSEQERGQAFDSLRRNYPVRREFQAFKIDLRSDDPALHNALSALGFRVKTA